MRKFWVIFLVFAAILSHAQKPKQLSSSEIYQHIKKLQVMGNVLYLAAHPDDENTRFISYCANEKLYNTAYLSLTRGDGGQNLIGTEIREQLGIIRTQELLAARRTDGGQQFFSRANDFGYSKTPDETLEIWDKEKILADVVWVIRKFKPDVIVCRFPTDGGGGHGHHTASALLGMEAFDKAADPNEFPEQLDYVDTWQAKRIVVNTGRWWNPDISADDEGVVAEDIGKFNTYMGTSYNELAAVSRTQHKSQGFGSMSDRGEHLEYFEHQKGEPAKTSLFDGMDRSWMTIEKDINVVEEVTQTIERCIDEFDNAHPEHSLGYLMTLKNALTRVSDKHWRKIKMAEVDFLIQQCAGLYVAANATDYWAVNGDSVTVNIEITPRTAKDLQLKRLVFNNNQKVEEFDELLAVNKKFEIKRTYHIMDIPVSQQYWLEKEGTLGTYAVDNQLMIGKPENPAALSMIVGFQYMGIDLNYAVPITYKWRDPVKGELHRPFVITPPAFVNFSQEAQLFSDLKPRKVEVNVKAIKEGINAKLKLSVPMGWQLSQDEFELTFTKKGEEQKVEVMLTPTAEATKGEFTAYVTVDGKSYENALKVIEYDHIPMQVYMPKAKANIVYINLKKKGNKVGYFAGAGDVTVEALTNIGYDVTELQEADLTPENLTQFDAIVVGIRALNVNHRADFWMPKLLAYTEAGGTLVLQYNTRHRLKTDKIGPYPIKLSRDRVTEEDAAVTFLAPTHPVLNTPNKITQEDFKGWVQERGLYFPNEWDEQYTPILSWHDKGEEAKTGSLLVAKYGKGHYVYTGISFFREFPAGVPGAYRLFVNLISLGNE